MGRKGHMPIKKGQAMFRDEYRILRIEGGEYQLCEGLEDTCRCGGCQRHRCGAK